MRTTPPRRPPRRRLRVGVELRRRPLLRRVLIGSVALGAGALVASTLQAAESAKAAWGETALVAVATRTLDPGDEIESGDIELVARPVALVPEGAVPDDVVGRTVHSVVVEGEVLVEARLAERGQRGVVARLPPGLRAVALPRQSGTTPDVETGQRVDVIVVLTPEEAADGPPGVVVAANALVVDVAEDAVTVAVEPEDATRVAVALAAGVVTIALAG